MSVTEEQGPQYCKTPKDLSVHLCGVKEVTMCKADTWWYLLSIFYQTETASHSI